MDLFSTILERVEEKRKDYAAYSFEEFEMAALNTFFDLAQEYDGLENLYMVSVSVPRVFFGLESNLYVIDPKIETIKWVANSHLGLNYTEARPPDYIRITDTPYQYGQAYVVPIQGKKTPTSRILFSAAGDVIGIFEVIKADHLSEPQLFFVQKYVNRIGYNLYNKFLAEQNIQHLKFINNLVADIEHNVIVPNLRYRHYFNKTREYLNTNKEIENQLDSLLGEIKSKDPELYAKISEIVEGMIVTNRGMFNAQETIERHYKHVSLFLESLLRRDHFVLGEYVLRKTPCKLWQDIVIPELEEYKDRFVQQDIFVDHIVRGFESGEDINIKVDKGLIAQVVANLFSNAAKYTDWVVDPSGRKVKRVECRTSLLRDFFGHGHHGVRLNVFSSGPPIDGVDSSDIFEEGFRAGRRASVEGRGHGLYFVKNVVEVHGGTVGYEARELGNEFYFVVPA
jgi:signal transduction histidine kinase